MKEIQRETEKKENYTFPQCERLGVLLLHGYTSHLSAVSDIVPRFEDMGVDVEMPLLRGHGRNFKALKGVRAEHWLDDAQNALENLASRCDGIVVVGLSMGGLLALQLSIMRPEKIVAVVGWAPALVFVNRFAKFSRFLAPFVPSLKSPDSFADAECRKKCRNYPRFTLDSFASLYELAQNTVSDLHRIDKALCLIHSDNDTVISPIASEAVYHKSSAPYKEIHRLMRSGHELGQDCEASTVFDITCDFVGHFLKKHDNTSESRGE